VDPRSVRRVTRSDDNIRPLNTGLPVAYWLCFLGRVYFLEGAPGRLLQGSLFEVSLALVGVSLPGLIPILVYSRAERNSFLYGIVEIFVTRC